MASTSDGPRGLGGWLILPMIALILTPIHTGAFLFNDFLPIYTEGYWELLTTPGSETYDPLWAPLIFYEGVGNVLFILFDIIMIFLFFSKHYKFPILYIAFLAGNLAFVIGDTILASSISAFDVESDTELMKELARSIFSSLIWIPYFWVSKRVKNTFVKDEPERIAEVFS